MSKYEGMPLDQKLRLQQLEANRVRHGAATLSEIKDLVTFAKSQGISRFRYGDLEITFRPDPLPYPSQEPTEKPKELTPEQVAQAEEDLLFMSSGA